MVIVSLADVHQRQHHENEGLEQDDQDVEDRPDCAGHDMADKAQSRQVRAERPDRTQQRDQQEHQFAGVHVAEQPHAQRHGLARIRSGSAAG